MIATGNHNFERFAALCNTLPGEAWALRAMFAQSANIYTTLQSSYIPAVVDFTWLLYDEGTVEKRKSQR